MKPDTPIYVGVDMGGTRIKCGLVADGSVLAYRVFAAGSHRPVGEALDEVKRQIVQLLDEQRLSASDCRGVGWGFPAIADHAAFRVKGDFKKFAGVAGHDFDAWSRAELGLPSAMENDARLALIGEWQHGAARGCDHAAIVTLGTGVGTAVLLDGRPLRGLRGSIGNLGGHTTAIAGGRRCFCGIDGCYESETGSVALPEVAHGMPNFDTSALAEVERIDYETLFRCADQGDTLAQCLRDRSIGLWANLCSDLVRHFGLQIVVVGGGVMRRADTILPVLQGRIDADPFAVDPRPRIAASELADQMALLGVPWLVEERLNRL